MVYLLLYLVDNLSDNRKIA